MVRRRGLGAVWRASETAGDHEPAREPDDEQRLGRPNQPAGHPVHAREHALAEPVGDRPPDRRTDTSPRMTAPRIGAEDEQRPGDRLEPGM